MRFDIKLASNEEIMDELLRRFPHIVVAGCNDEFIGDGETLTDIMFTSGHMLKLLGLLSIARLHIEREWKNTGVEADDAP